MATRRKILVTEPFQAHELPRTFDLRKIIKKLDYSRLVIERTCPAAIILGHFRIARVSDVLRLVRGDEAK